MIKLIDLNKSYNKKVQALKNINLHIKPGEFVSIVGQSGSGKSTLVKLVIAEERPDSGKIVIGGWDIIDIKDREIPTLRRQLGVIFQDFKLLPKKTVFENVAFAMEACGFKSLDIAKTVSQIISLVGLKGKEDRYPNQLSGGEQQRVAIARSLVHKPKLLVADEPTGNLDSINTREIIDLLKKINNMGTTIVLVTHNKDVVNGLHSRVITLDSGQIISDQSQGRYLL
ncbi:MAG: cell division ATP-binding protein FtsE [Candidatus Komeilibacteria bacterium RIFOXYC1_FULL_37_11]|uniref:Cell division ATP-binding protein FtsE n=1 Tax=Candidatus Komeilibacteria bacterium RIFOXYC1_FULL_37_11 TaxID=1798555 RepID=A0A1G2BXV6_9BACT|nr:MAG: cell division ATP-binding protein FtsE [Candidatus Komeilibacteria bacterium RIFOXYC1_FULL_37_11]OGY96048.1 MAG: cell division ATP-binding protein FtsE [Candidatus Komeilibacteria bacterium RIFOXYD1_FULL_37_29]OGY96724.1 MAG: cell division ATP-binding protein FtsE [Candidatus Komeilibacteria bacterium RIFOXYD2_FULL_37_8]